MSFPSSLPFHEYLNRCGTSNVHKGLGWELYLKLAVWGMFSLSQNPLACCWVTLCYPMEFFLCEAEASSSCPSVPASQLANCWISDGKLRMSTPFGLAPNIKTVVKSCIISWKPHWLWYLFLLFVFLLPERTAELSFSQLQGNNRMSPETDGQNWYLDSAITSIGKPRHFFGSSSSTSRSKHLSDKTWFVFTKFAVCPQKSETAQGGVWFLWFVFEAKPMQLMVHFCPITSETCRSIVLDPFWAPCWLWCWCREQLPGNFLGWKTPLVGREKWRSKFGRQTYPFLSDIWHPYASIFLKSISASMAGGTPCGLERREAFSASACVSQRFCKIFWAGYAIRRML